MTISPNPVRSGPARRSHQATERGKENFCAHRLGCPRPPRTRIFPTSSRWIPSNLPAVWQAALRLLANHGPVLSSLLAPGQLVAIDDGRALIQATPPARYLRQTSRTCNGKKDLVREKLSELLGQAVGVKFEVDPNAPTEPHPKPTTAPNRAITPPPSRSAGAASPSRPTPTVPGGKTHPRAHRIPEERAAREARLM